MKYDNHILESRIANCINIPNSKLDVVVCVSRKRICIYLVDPHFREI